MSRLNTAGNQDDERFVELNNRLELLVRATENLLEERHREQANQTARPQDPDVTRRIAQFKPPTYDGCADPKKLENWIREFEKIFDVVGCSNIMKVSQATFYLWIKPIYGGLRTGKGFQIKWAFRGNLSLPL